VSLECPGEKILSGGLGRGNLQFKDLPFEMFELLGIYGEKKANPETTIQ